MDERKSFNTPVLYKGLLLVFVGVVFLVVNSDNFRKWVLIPSPMVPLKIGTAIWPGYEPLYLARELGYYDNSPIRLVEYTSATQVIRAYRNNAIQLAALTMDEVLLLLENGLDTRVILVMDISRGGDTILAKPEIKNLKDLRGRKVGVERTALGAFFLSQALNSVGLHPEDVNIISSENNEHERRFLENQFDAVVTFEPVSSRLLAKGAHKLFDSTQIPGEIVDVLLIAKDTLDHFPEEVGILLTGWFKALDYLNTRPEEAAPILARRLKVSPKEVLDSYKGLKLPGYKENLKLMVGPEAPLKKSSTRLANVMLKQKLLQREVVLADFIDSSVLKKIEVATKRVNGSSPLKDSVGQ
ncbi:MAG: ABC transporter substrate-binding protein [Nitrospina sp.]|nr:ABC transporter substrate-binding protein [Nitrospina sp.]MBT5633433.1 ABC transporter substrate-binding protein [Nitrospina sp.]